jgi:hypothetical protein
MSETPTDRIAEALQTIASNTWSPNVADSNLENANLVDVLDKIASGAYAIARSIERLVDEGITTRGDTGAL